MHYELTKTRTSVRLYEVGSPDAWIIPNNYELRIMNYELTKTRTSVRLYEGWITRCVDYPQQL